MRSNSHFQDKQIKLLFKKLNILVRGYSGLDKKNLVIYISISDKQLLDKVFGESTQGHTVYGIPIRIKKEGEPLLSKLEVESRPLEDL